ncbi:MAG TPA: biopolymer transporter ExbD [Elusimicrobiota bacterium]|nr:biopolymer transporter ExbD [Elusimicrobiota bacterium]
MSNDDEPLSEVNVIPLADLSLVLLIVLMVLSPMITQALIQVAAAKAAAAQTKEEMTDPNPETPVVVSYAPGILKLNGVQMGSDLEFVKRLDAVMAGRRDKSVNITASPVLTHGKVVRLLDVVRHHGAASLVMLKWSDNPLGTPAPHS